MSALTTGARIACATNRAAGEYGRREPIICERCKGAGRITEGDLERPCYGCATSGRSGSRFIRLGLLHGDVELWVDADSLFRQMATKAIRSKGKKAQIGGGAVVVRAVRVEQTPDTKESEA